MLSSFMSKRKAKKISLFDAALRRSGPQPQSPESPASFSSPGVSELLESRQAVERKAPALRQPSRLYVPPHHRESSPRVFLDIRAESLDWFPREILNGDMKFAVHELPEGNDEPELQAADDIDVVLIQPETKKSSPTEPPPSSSKSTQSSPYSLKTASPSNGSLGVGIDPPILGGVPRKPTPAPLKIPSNHSKFHAARSSSTSASGKVHNITHSSSNSALSGGISRPSSIITTDDVSAISGTTLARALIANSFSLSSDHARPKYRSGGVTRQDSATLPGGENGLINSPYLRDKRLYAGEIVSPDSGRSSPVPPVPPLPPNIDMAPGADFVHVSNRVNSNVKRSNSSRSRSPPRSSEDQRGSKHVSSRHERQSFARRVSRASFNLSPVPSMPNTPEKPACPTPSPSNQHTSFSAPTPFHGDLLSAGTTQTEKFSPGLPTGSVTSAGSGDDIDNVLNNYQFVSPFKSSFPVSSQLPNFSPSLSATFTRTTDIPASTTTKPSSASIFTPVSGAWIHGKRSNEIYAKATLIEAGASGSSRLSFSSRHGLLPIGDLPRATHLSHSSISQRSEDSTGSNTERQSISSRNSIGTRTPDLLDSMFLPHRPKVAAPTRPNPIQVFRESLDLESYDVADSASSTTDALRQTFPETPQAFTPLLSAASLLPKSFSMSANDYISPGMVPRSASAQRGIKGRRMFPPMPKRSSSLTNKRLPLSSARPGMSPIPSTPTPLVSPFDDSTGTDSNAKTSPPSSVSSAPGVLITIAEQLSEHLESDPSNTDTRNTDYSSTPITPDTGSSVLRSTETSNITTPDYSDKDNQGSRDMNLASASSSARIENTDSSVADLVASIIGVPDQRISKNIKPLPQKPKSVPIEAQRCRSRSISPSVVRGPVEASSQPSQRHRHSALPQPPQLRQFFQPPQRLQSLQPLQESEAIQMTQSHQPTQPPQPVQSSQPPQPPKLSFDTSTPPVFINPFDTNRSEELYIPPPSSYRAAVQPETSTSTVPSYGHERSTSFGVQSRTAGSSTLKQEQFERRPSAPTAYSELGTSKRPSRSRPPLPAGPRKPSAGRASLLIGGRNRNVSVSSATSASNVNEDGCSSRKSSERCLYQRTPKFQTTPVRWRGTPMDIAKWTFTSQQMQHVVSRAIKQTADGSSIRLLKVEVLDNEVPEEMHRLELLSTDIKARYKLLVGRRRELLNRLTGHVVGSDLMDEATLYQTMDDLTEASENVEQLAEELYTVTDQISQLKRLCDIHTGSALSVALRKLNASFIRQATEAQYLRARVAALEASRDVAWPQDVAHELDVLTNNSALAQNANSRCASWINAVGKSGFSGAKPNVGPTVPSSANSQLRNSASIQQINAAATSSKPTFASSIRTRHRPPIIQTNAPELPLNSLSSCGGLYTGMTPSSETRALAQAQKELYEMLGIKIKDLRTMPQRPHSISSLGQRTPSPGVALKRRNSDLPTSARNREYYFDPSASDREVMLATLGMTE